MGWRLLFISKNASLSLKGGQIVIGQQETGNATVPLEDVAAVIVDAYQSDITGNLLSAMAENGIAYFSCDERHTPNGVFLPFHTHSRLCQTANLQKDWAEPFKKRLWQKVIKRKILNQALALRHTGRPGYEKLETISEMVQSGDTGNSESVAAVCYWKALFYDFTRVSDSDLRNKALNYGYAIVRGAMARALCGAGLLPCFGLFHNSELNAFNLADDMMEPFRPLIDCTVFEIFGEHKPSASELTLDHKQKLVGTLGQKCRLGDEIHSVLSATEQSSYSLANCTREKDFNRLVLPEMRNAGN